MITQPRKWPTYLAAIVLAIYVFSNPAKAADLVNSAADAIVTFATGLGA
jgi:hypothetical protein